jgi:hypothetical protein
LGGVNLQPLPELAQALARELAVAQVQVLPMLWALLARQLV